MGDFDFNNVIDIVENIDTQIVSNIDTTIDTNIDTNFNQYYVTLPSHNTISDYSKSNEDKESKTKFIKDFRLPSRVSNNENSESSVNSETSVNSESSVNNNLNTILNDLSNYSESMVSKLIVCSSITIVSLLCFSLLFILFISLLYLF